MRLALSVVCAVLAATACTKANPDYCDDTTGCPGGGACDPVTHTCGEATDSGPADAGADAAIQCTMSEECQGICTQNMCVPCGAGDCAARTDGKNVCNGDGVCVACVTNEDCGDLSAPICDNEMCRTCANNGECETLSGTPGQIGVCNGAGACVGDSGTIFVDNSSPCTSPDGSAAMPYCVIQDAVDDVTGAKNVILVRPGNYAPATIADKTVTLVGQGLPHVSLGSAATARLEVTGSTADVTIRGFVLTGATTDPAAGLWCRNNSTCRLERSDVGPNAYGVYAQNADLTLERTTIHENASGGLLTIAADFTVENTLFWGNGGSSIGAAQLGTNGPSGRRAFRNNTLFSNFRGPVAGSVGAVQCTVATILTSNIFWGNDSPMIGALCVVDHSVIDDATIGMLATNTTGDPLFVSTNPVAPDLHIQPLSSAIGLSEAAGAPATDFDGEARDDGAPDTGADELVP